MAAYNKMQYKTVVALGFLIYFFSYTMRLDYAATIVAIVSDLDITNTMASMAVTGSFFTYGIGQLIFGFIGDKISPIKIINIAMLGTILVNILVSFCSNIAIITVLWCINGVCQAMLWPPLTRFVSEQVDSNKYSNAITIVGLSASIGTIFIYLLVPVVLVFTTWRNVFRCMAFFGIIILAIWFFSTKNISMGKAEVTDRTNENKGASVWGLITLAGLIPIFIVIALQGILRDGVQTWLPSLVKEQFNLSEETSVLSTTVIPIISMISVTISNTIYRKLQNEVKTAAIMFAVAFGATIPMLFGANVPALIMVVLAALISGCMHGVNLMLISFMPKRFSKYGMVSTFSGILNAFTYLGASISTYGFAVVADNFGWNSVLICWIIFAFLAMAICILKIKAWRGFIKRNI